MQTTSLFILKQLPVSISAWFRAEKLQQLLSLPIGRQVQPLEALGEDRLELTELVLHAQHFIYY